MTSLPFYSDESISLTSKIKKLGQFEDQIGIGVDIGKRSIKVVGIDSNGNIIKGLEEKARKEEGYTAVILQAIALIRRLIGNLDVSRLKSIGVGIPGGIGPIFVRRMIIMEDWKDVNLRAMIENSIGLPTFVENDANVIAIGEIELSKTKGDFFALTLEDNVGGAIVINNRILHGDNYFAGELGHVIVDMSKDAWPCGCGNKGCLEAYVSGTTMSKIVQKKASNQETLITQLIDGDLQQIVTEFIAEAAQLGDELAVEVLDRAAENIAKAIQIIAEITGINEVLIGSRVAKFGNHFYENIRENLKTRFISKSSPIQLYEFSIGRIPEIIRRYVGAVGAAIMGMQKVEERSEKVIVVIKNNDDEMGKTAAQIIAQQIRRKPNTVLGLATGSTPISTYKELVRMHKEEDLDFSQVRTFNLDEYYPIGKENPQSYHTFMYHWFFKHINIDLKNVHVPDGEIDEEQIDGYCKEYEQKIYEAGGIDIQVLGIGGGYFNKKGKIVGGHIGFNEAGSDFFSRTRKICLADKTRTDNARFFRHIEEVPRYAITMGIQTILEAKRIILLASGEHKAQIVRQSVEGKITPYIPASFLQTHSNTTFLIERGAASKLSRMVYPWLFFDMDWSVEREKSKSGENHIDNALIWLSMTLKKPLNQLAPRDFHNNFLSELLKLYDYNVPVLVEELIERIDAKILYKEKFPRNKTILVISPSPGDEVINFGNIVRALGENGNKMKIINVVSGNTAVRNSDVIEYCEQNNFDISIRERIIQNTIDSEELLQLKTLIRKSESIDSHKFLGTPSENLIFLNSPFYETEATGESVITDADILPLSEILNQELPDIVFIPEKVSDGHRTHTIVTKIFEMALNHSKIAIAELWYYKFEDYNIHEADRIIPFTEKEMDLKIHATQKYKTQLVPLFPGSDPRPLWQRTKNMDHYLGTILKTLGVVPQDYNYASTFKIRQFSKSASAR